MGAGRVSPAGKPPPESGEADRTSGRYPASPAVAVGAVVRRGDAVLLVRRAKPPSESLWAIPGGSVELGESLQAAAEREILEETGITVRAGQPVYIFDVIDRDPDGRIRYHYVITDLLAEYVSGEPVAGDDALEARWVGPEELHRLPVSATTLELLEGGLGFGAAG